MKITMIGTSGSGKTVFSAGVYATFMREAFQGFNIFPQGDNLANQLIESHRFAQDYKVLARLGWPKGTDGFFPYALDLYYEGEKITNFDWIDYKGGFLDENEINPSKSVELYANIAASNAVILFADAEKLSKFKNPKQAAFESGADAVMQVIRGFSLKYPGSKLIFLIALTKCDAVDGEFKGADYSYQGLMDFGEKVFFPIKEVIQREKLWRGGIIPISGVGEGNVDKDNKIVAFPEPLHIEHVMAFSISSVLRIERSDMIKDILNAHEDETRILKRYEGFIGAIRQTYNYFKKITTDQEALHRIRKEMLNDFTQLAKINTPLEKLADIAMKKVRIIT